MSVPARSALMFGMSLWVSGVAWGQAPAITAKIEALPLELRSPDRYQVPAILLPIRHVTLSVTMDGILRSLDLPVGAAVREHQEVGQLDRAEAAARLKIARANLKEADSVVKNSTIPSATATAKAQLEAAEARAELAELDLERCTLRAPFSGRLLDVAVSPGQFLPKGAKIADLADVSSLRVQIPLERSAATVGGTVSVLVEGQPMTGKVQATLPLPETFNALRELATSFTAAWVILPNAKGDLEPGQRVLSPSLPTSPIANIPSRAVREPKKGDPVGTTIQVIRNEYVADIPVRVMGHPGPERVQVSGLLRPNDALIVSSSQPLIAGTLIRFSGASPGAVEGTNPNPAEGGELAGITPPRANSRGAGGDNAASRNTPRQAPRPPAQPMPRPGATAF